MLPMARRRLLHTLPEHPLKGAVSALMHQRPFQHMLKGANGLGMLPVPVEVALGASVPAIAAVVYIGLHGLKASVMGSHGSPKR